MKKFLSGWYGNLLILTLIAVSVYFINIEVQSYFGRQALEKTGLQRFTLDQALKKAKSENKQIMVDISAIWCSNCRRLDKEIFAEESVKNAINEKFVFVRLEYESDEGTAFLEKNQAEGFPSLWILDNNGNTLRQLPITFNPEKFINQL